MSLSKLAPSSTSGGHSCSSLSSPQRKSLSSQKPRTSTPDLFQLGDDALWSLLSWLDIKTICRLDIAIGNYTDRSLWFKLLNKINNVDIDNYRLHGNLSVKWMIKRSVCCKNIVSGGSGKSEYSQSDIEDKTFSDLGKIPLTDAELEAQIRLRTSQFVSESRSKNDIKYEDSTESFVEQCMYLADLTGRFELELASVSALIKVEGIAGPKEDHYEDDITNNDDTSDDNNNTNNNTDNNTENTNMENINRENIDVENNIADINTEATLNAQDNEIIEIDANERMKIFICEKLKLLEKKLVSYEAARDLQDALYYHNNRMLYPGSVRSVDHNQFFNLNSIYLYGCVDLTDIGVTQIAKNSPNLTKLFMQDCENVTDAGIHSIAEYCNKLKYFSIYNCIDITDTSLESIANYCKDLDEIILSNDDRFTHKGISAIAKSCHKLTKIYFTQCDGIIGESLSIISKNCPLLTDVNISYCDNMTDFGIEEIARNCPLLSSLIIRDCPNISYRSMSTVAQYSKKLTKIEFSLINTLDQGLNQIIQKCPLLSHIQCSDSFGTQINSLSFNTVKNNLLFINLNSLQFLTDDCLLNIGKNCPNLTSFNISQCESVTHLGISSLVEGCHKLNHFQMNRMENINDSCLISVGKNCPELTSIIVTVGNGLHGMTKIGMKAIAVGCVKLKSILILCLLADPDECLTEFAKNCKSLKSVIFDPITDLGCLSFAENCPTLTNFRVGGDERFTDAGLFCLAIFCPKLRTVELGKGCRITDEGTKVLFLRCKDMKSVDWDN